MLNMLIGASIAGLVAMALVPITRRFPRWQTPIYVTISVAALAYTLLRPKHPAGTWIAGITLAVMAGIGLLAIVRRTGWSESRR